MVEELDGLMEDYIAEANVVVPRRNPNFDPTKFDPSTIGVEAGGLKMPPGFNGNPTRKRGSNTSGTVNNKSMLGWIAKNAEPNVEGDSLRISPAGRKPFIANARVRAIGPAQVRLRIRTQKDGTGGLQWRTEGQGSFPETGQHQSFNVVGGDWQELSVPLHTKGKLIHVRLILPDSKRPTEIDWVEIGPKDKDAMRWDFGNE